MGRSLTAAHSRALRWLPLFAFAPLAILVFSMSSLTVGYAKFLAFTLLVNITLALSYDLMGGLLGYLHLGHGLFFGIGSYAAALALGQGLHISLALLVAAAGAASAAYGFSWPLFRLRAEVFALATLGLLYLAEHLTTNLSPWTGGAAGLSLPPDPASSWVQPLALLLTLSVALGHNALRRSRMGSELLMIRENEEMAESVGIDINRAKRRAFLLSAAPAAAMGGIYAREISFLVPSDAFGLDHSLGPVLMCMLLRPGTTWGPLVAAVILTAVQEMIWTTVPQLHLSLYGIFLMALGVLHTHRGSAR
jgi:branched-chain amino acid transport system permease protein